MEKIKKSYTVHIVKFTPWTYYRIGHYRVYEHEEGSEHMRNITERVAKDCWFSLDRNWDIRIKQWWMDGRRDLEQRIYKHYWYEWVRVFILWDR